MFQDEARFGRISDPKRCWVPAPYRPKVMLALVREYKYIYGAVCPKTGHLDYMDATDMKTNTMSMFLRQVSKSHPNKFIVMVVDGASSHKSKDLVIPSNVSLVVLPPYSPELNPTERIWNILRRDYFSNRYFPTLIEAMEQAKSGLAKIKINRAALRKLTCWPWIKLVLKAT